MKKIIFAFLTAALVSFGLAQTSSPGHGSGDDPDFNEAHAWISIDTPMPTQVAFTLPQVNFTLDLAHIVPNNTLVLRIAVTNDTDRPVVLSDDGLVSDTELNNLGFTITAPDKQIGAGVTDWFTYNIGMPDAAELSSLISDAEAGNLPHNDSGGGGYYQNVGTNGVLRAVTKILATGVLPNADPTADFGF